MSVTTWGELTDEWIGRTVIVRWEDPGVPLAEGLPSGMPHELSGFIELDWNPARGYQLHQADINGYTSGFPAHAIVQERTT